MKKTVFDIFRDREEAPLLYACMNRPDDLDARRRYCRFLDASGDARAEPLRLHLQLLTEPRQADGRTTQTAALRARLRQLVESVDRVWWVSVAAPPETFNCGQTKSAASPHVRFRFECPQSWERLTPTTDPERRFCELCHESVHFADSLGKAESLARQGVCIAVPRALVDKAGRSVAENSVGRPDWRRMWAERLFGPLHED